MILRQTQNIRLSNYGPHRHKVDIGSYIVRVCDESCVSLYTCLLVYGAQWSKINIKVMRVRTNKLRVMKNER